MSHEQNKSQEDNNNGTLGREVDAEHGNQNPNSIENEAVSEDGFAENERHWPHIETNISPKNAEQGAKNYPGERIDGQISHAENNEGTAADGV